MQAFCFRFLPLLTIGGVAAPLMRSEWARRNMFAGSGISAIPRATLCINRVWLSFGWIFARGVELGFGPDCLTSLSRFSAAPS